MNASVSLEGPQLRTRCPSACLLLRLLRCLCLSSASDAQSQTQGREKSILGPTALEDRLRPIARTKNCLGSHWWRGGGFRKPAHVLTLRFRPGGGCDQPTNEFLIPRF